MLKRFGLLAALLPLAAAPALAHHPMESMGLEPTALTGLISGLAHPVLGPDHLLFLLVLGLVGWQRSLRSALVPWRWVWAAAPWACWCLAFLAWSCWSPCPWCWRVWC